jgi:hypothetical protein
LPAMRKLGLLSPSRVTRFAEIWYIESLFTLGNFLKITEIAKIFWPLFSTAKVAHKFWQKMRRARFWAILWQTHPVTVPPSILRHEKKSSAVKSSGFKRTKSFCWQKKRICVAWAVWNGDDLTGWICLNAVQ